MNEQKTVDDKVRATVGVVVYNTAMETLEATLGCLLKSEPKVRVIILCNSPLAEYQRDIANLAKRFGVDLLANRPNDGFGAGHNTIVKAVTSEWYVCCNPDAFVNPETINKLISFGSSAADSVLIGPRIYNLDGSIQLLARKHITIANWVHRQLWRHFPKVFSPAEIRFDYEMTQRAEFVSGAFFAVRVEHYRALGGFSEDYFLYCEDADLARRACDLGSNYYVADAWLTHGWSRAWQHSWRHISHELRSLLRYFRKFGFY